MSSLIATVVNYSISLGLGVAGVAVKYTVSTDAPTATLQSIQIASYVACGLAAFGIVVSIGDLIYSQFKRTLK